MPTTPEMASLPGYQSYQHSAEIGGGGGVGVVACLPRLGLLLVWESAISIEVLKRTAARAWRVWGEVRARGDFRGRFPGPLNNFGNPNPLSP